MPSWSGFSAIGLKDLRLRIPDWSPLMKLRHRKLPRTALPLLWIPIDLIETRETFHLFVISSS